MVGTRPCCTVNTAVPLDQPDQEPSLLLYADVKRLAAKRVLHHKIDRNMHRDWNQMPIDLRGVGIGLERDVACRFTSGQQSLAGSDVHHDSGGQWVSIGLLEMLEHRIERYIPFVVGSSLDLDVDPLGSTWLELDLRGT